MTHDIKGVSNLLEIWKRPISKQEVAADMVTPKPIVGHKLIRHARPISRSKSMENLNINSVMISRYKQDDAKPLYHACSDDKEGWKTILENTGESFVAITKDGQCKIDPHDPHGCSPVAISSPEEFHRNKSFMQTAFGPESCHQLTVNYQEVPCGSFEIMTKKNEAQKNIAHVNYRWIDGRLRNRGIMEEASIQAYDHIFTTTSAEAITNDVYLGNVPQIRLNNKLGAKRCIRLQDGSCISEEAYERICKESKIKPRICGYMFIVYRNDWVRKRKLSKES